MLCPRCSSKLNDHLTCESHHSFQLHNGVPALVTPEFKQRLDVFTDNLVKYRQQEENRKIKESLFDELPFTRDVPQAYLWNAKQLDLEFIEQFTAGKKGLRILEVGAWNGWLSNRLSKSGHRVWAIDYLNDEYDGLGAHKHYTNQEWRPLQVDLNDLSLFKDEKFDLIIVNRCSIFFTNPFSTFDFLKTLLCDQGSLLITGLQIFKNWKREKERIETMKKVFFENHGFEMFMFPIKGYFNKDNLRELSASGFRIVHFPHNWKNWVKRNLLPNSHFNCLAIYSSKP